LLKAGAVEEALLDFTEAKKLDETDQFIDREMMVVKKMISAKREKEKKAYGRMFD
jgi:hypothetical protein